MGHTRASDHSLPMSSLIIAIVFMYSKTVKKTNNKQKKKRYAAL